MTANASLALRGVPRLSLVGTVLTLPGAVSAELLAEPFDVVWIDLEHGALDRAQAQEMILGAQAVKTLAYVRVGVADAERLTGPMLDAGADGIVAADVRSGEQAEALARLMRYPPKGQRGYGPRRSLLRGRSWPGERDPGRLWLQIESQQGAAAAHEIALAPGAEALIVGIADLCTDLGIPIGLADPRLHDALHAIRTAAEQVGVRFGLAGPLQAAEQLGHLLDDASVMVHSTDARICAEAVDSVAQTLRGYAHHAFSAPDHSEVSAGG